MTEKEQVINSVIPAQPGWFVAWYMPAEGDDAARFSYEPIVAWAISATFKEVEPDAYCTPITAMSGDVKLMVKTGIKSPDGQIDFFDTRWPNEEAALEGVAKQKLKVVK